MGFFSVDHASKLVATISAFVARLLLATGFAAVLMMASPPIYSQTQGRPIVQPKNEAERLRWSLDSQKKQINESQKTVDLYNSYLRKYEVAAETTRSALRKAEKLEDRTSSSWNTRVNPTCDNGHTYARCSCADGLTGKAELKALIARARQTTDLFSADLKRYYQLLIKTRTDYTAFLKSRAEMNARLIEGEKTYSRMIENRGKPPGSPDSFKEIEQRAKKQ